MPLQQVNSSDYYRRVFLIVQVVIWLGFFFLYTFPLSLRYNLQTGLAIGTTSLVYAMSIVYINISLFNYAFNSRPRKYGQYLTGLLGLFIIGGIFMAFAAIFINYYFDLEIVRSEKEYPLHLNQFRIIQAALFRFIYTFMESFIYVFISLPIKFSFDYFVLQSKQQNIENQKLQAELKYLKLQINPHFLFNTLNNLLYLTHKKSAQAPKVIEKLAFLMRYMLEQGNENRVPLSTEIDFLLSYLDLEKIRIPQVEVDFDVQGDVEQTQVPPLMFITLIENAFKHGIDKTSAYNHVDINLAIGSKTIKFCIANSMVDPPLTYTHNGIGIQNLIKRLKLLFPGNFELKTEKTKDKKYIATLIIPK